MIKTLVVEDDADKRFRLCRALSEVTGFDMEAMEYATDVHTAKRHLEKTSFDLLILDVALPMRGDQAVQKDAGLRLLEELVSRSGRYRVPTHIIGVTGFSDVYDHGAARFSSYLLTLVHYDPTNSDWEHALQARVRHILNAIEGRADDLPEYQSDLAVVCALHTPELTSVLALPWKWSQIAVANDHTIYWRGSYESDGRTRLVHAAASARMGMPAASVLAMKMINAFRPKYLGMTGITAGVRNRVRMGDILIADPSWDWGSGKWTLQEKKPKFMAAPHQIPLRVDIRDKLKAMSRNAILMAEIRSAWPAERPPHELEMRVGPMASGASVLADRQTAERVLSQHRELLGIEMETYGLFAAAEEASEPRPTAFAMKSVVDFADGEKDDRFQAYGAFVSAQMLRRFAEKYL